MHSYYNGQNNFSTFHLCFSKLASELQISLADLLNSNKWDLRKIKGVGLCFLNAITLGYNELGKSNDAIKPIALNELV